MISQQIQMVLAPPNVEDARQWTLLLLNSRFKSLDELEGLDLSIEDSRRRREEFCSQVRSHDRRWNLQN
jgi:hypothetical protein